MARGREPALVFLVHVAGVPAPDHIQRCVACGVELLDNRARAEGRVAVSDGDAGRGPTWWPPGALVATDKPRNGTGVSMTYVVDGGDLDDDERPCTPAR
jgi:hypothetical protein